MALLEAHSVRLLPADWSLAALQMEHLEHLFELLELKGSRVPIVKVLLVEGKLDVFVSRLRLVVRPVANVLIVLVRDALHLHVLLLIGGPISSNKGILTLRLPLVL